MPLLQVEQLNYRLGHRVLFSNISFSIESGERQALVGANGTGKTTLLEMLVQNTVADQGKITFQQGIDIAYLNQKEPDIDPHLSGQDFLYSAHNPFYYLIKNQTLTLSPLQSSSTPEKCDHLLRDLPLGDITIPFHQLSGGTRKKLLLAKILTSGAQLIILDEPTNHLDLTSILWLTQQLQNLNSTLLFSTHDRYFLDEIGTGTFEIFQGQMYKYEAGWLEYLEKRQHREEMRQSQLQKTANILRREASWASKQPKARGTKQKARVSQVGWLASEVNRLQKAQSQEATLTLNCGVRLGKTILECENLGAAYPASENAPTQFVWRKLNYYFTAKDRILVMGANGSGKTTLMRMLNKELPAAEGRINWGQNTQILYFSQHNRIELNEQRTVYDELLYNLSEYVELGERRVHLRTYLTQYLFTTEEQNKPIHKLSGGERKRLIFAKFFARPANFLILDEPTNDLDCDTLTLLEQTLIAYEGCIIFTSHDRHFMDFLPNKVFWINDQTRQIEVHAGNYSYVTELISNRLQEAKGEAKLPNSSSEEKITHIPSPPIKQVAKAKTLTGNERRELQELPSKIEQIENQIADFQMQMGLPENTSSFNKLTELQKQISVWEEKLNKAFERWDTLTRMQESEK